MKLAFVYAGQGSQHVGMGKDFYQQFPQFAELFDHAPVDFDLKQLCFEGPEEQLAQTRYTQPCMAAFAVGVTDLLYQEGIRPQIAAGLSLGEYSALYAAGVFSRGTVISTVALRGWAMEEAAAGLDCSMTAVLGLDREKLQQACDGAAELGVVQICNYNCPGQLVIGGEKAAVDKAGELAKELGAKRCMPLKVSGPMEEGDAIPALLERQVQSSVYWEDTIRRMEADGIDTVVEIGPGKALCGFFKKTAPGIKTYHIDTAADFHSVVSALKGATA